MAQVEAKKPIILAEGEKSSLIMLYSPAILIRGEVVTGEAMRVSTWLRTPAAPEYMHIQNAQVVLLGISGPLQSFFFQDYFVPSNQVTAYHLVPPASDPVDYDQSEPNRKLEPVTVMVGGFRFNGSLRMASQTDLGKYLDMNREAFISVYDVDISNPGIPGMALIHVAMALVRNRSVTVAARVGTAV
jgi:hypothetical protein